MNDVKTYLESCRLSVNSALDAILPSEASQPYELHRAMRYSVLNGGKRLRSAFIYATGEALGAAPEVLRDLCIAIELIHAFSLIHDDLPALDNDDLRRGKPTCHKIFGEATAILAGDALHSLAFEVLSRIELAPEVVLKMVGLLSHAIGSQGMIGGETLDVQMTNQKPLVEEVEYMYALKTSSLLSASMVLATLASECSDADTVFNIAKFAEHLGLAFQIHDDIIGIESDTATLGKKQQADVDLNKPVYPLLVGMQKAKQRRDMLLLTAKQHLAQIQTESTLLESLADFVIARDY